MEQQMQIGREDYDEVTLLTVQGELSVMEAGRLKRSLGKLLEEDRLKVIIDLANVDYIGSSALSILLMFSRQVRDRKGRLVLVGLQPLAREAMAVIGLLNTVETAGTVRQAKARLQDS